MKRKYTLVIEETVTDEFEVFAESREEALKKAIENYKKGIFVLEPGHVQHRQMAVVDPRKKDEIDWVEF
jgi:hypothetical protein